VKFIKFVIVFLKLEAGHLIVNSFSF